MTFLKDILIIYKFLFRQNPECQLICWNMIASFIKWHFIKNVLPLIIFEGATVSPDGLWKHADTHLHPRYNRADSKAEGARDGDKHRKDKTTPQEKKAD